MTDPERVLRIIAALVDGRLPPETAARLDIALLCADADLAMVEASSLIDSTGEAKLWSVATRLETELEVLEADGIPPPDPRLADCLGRIAACPKAPRDARNIVRRLG